MAIEFECPACGATIRVKDEAANKKGRCPKCKTLLLVPEPEDAGAAEVPPAAPAPKPPPSVPPPPLSAAPPTVIMPRSAVPPVELPPELPVPQETPAPSPAMPAFGDPASPFVIVAEPEPLIRPVATRRPGPPTAAIVSAVAGVLGIGIVLLVGWLLYRASAPDLSGTIAGDRLASAPLEPASFPLPADVPSDATERVMTKLSADPLSLKSEYAEVTLRGSGNRMRVTVSPGPQAAPVRVPLGRNADVKAALGKRRKSIEETKSQELNDAAAEFFRDYNAYLDQKKPLTRAAEYRDAVALNATTGLLGYVVEAVIADHKFRCVAEDEDGRCYFFLPPRTKRFRIRGRQLPDGTTPLPVDFEVTVREVAEETVKVEVDERPATDAVPESGSEETKPAGESVQEGDSPPAAEGN